VAVFSTQVLSFGISGALAGLAGVLYAENLQYISPQVPDISNSLTLFIALFLGGIGTLVGPLIGTAVITVINQILTHAGSYSALGLGLILLAGLTVVPKGIVGTWVDSRLSQRAWIAGTPRRTRRVKDPGHLMPARQASTDRRPTAAAAPGTAGGAAPGAGSSVVMDVKGLSKRFGSIEALGEVSLSVAAGEVHGVIGPNGAGKSTLVSCMSAQLHPDVGTVSIGGAPLSAKGHHAARQGVTRVFQVPHLFEQVSVLDNVLTGMHMRIGYGWLSAALRLPRFWRGEQAARAEALGLLEIVGIAELADRPASILSHGQKRLAEIARALATEPQVLILDEPATGLNALELARLQAVIEDLKARGMSIVLIEHNVEFVMGLCDVITVLNFGKVIAEGDPRSVRASPEVQTAYLGASTTEEVVAPLSATGELAGP
jgi:ABC-type branched-subunit amino acid transport system ATPase component